MKIDVLSGQPDPPLAIQLKRFESAFRYPLGAGRSFRISHGDDYTRFFRAIGNARCFVAHDADRVLGVVSVSICRMFPPHGVPISAAYFSDLKLASPELGRVLLRLLSESIAWARQHADRCFSVVMDGTTRSPDRYTGRLGIPKYNELSKLMILRVPVSANMNHPVCCKRCPIDEARNRFHVFSRDAFRTSGGDSELRSVMRPMGLILDSGEACGVLEDTRRVKLLFADDGAEMISAHLGCLGYASPGAAATLIRSALSHCQEIGVPSLFAGIRRVDSTPILEALSMAGVVEAPATVYGFGFPEATNWFINTSEI